MTPGPLSTAVADDRIRIGDHFTVSLQRTLRLPDDGRDHPLPPGLGRLPVSPVAELGEVPPGWSPADVLVPLHRREALWLSFSAPWWRPLAVRVGVGGVDAVSGGPWDDELHTDPQNYVVCPDQPWLDGINTGAGTVRQFVAVDLGAGDTVEEQLTGAAAVGGIQVRVFEPRPGRFADSPPADEAAGLEMPQAAGMGLAPGGVMRQRIHPDPYGVDTWDPERFGTAHIHLVGSRRYQELTGAPAPPSPISAADYGRLGLPWFELADEQRGDVRASERLAGAQSLGERDARRGTAPDEADDPVEPHAVVELTDLGE